MLPESNSDRIVIIGGGFAGINLAKSLQHTDYQVLLLDKQNYHAFQPLLYQVSTFGLEPDSIAYPLRKLLNKADNLFFKLAEVTSINTSQKLIHSNIGDINYDKLVICTGTEINFFGNDAIKKHAYWMKSVSQALNLRSRILENLEKASNVQDTEEKKAFLRFVIAGAGPTGVELCGALGELKQHIFKEDYPEFDSNDIEIILLEGQSRVLPVMSKTSSTNAENYLRNLSVKVKTDVMVTNYDGNQVKTSQDEVIPTYNFIWSAGVKGATVEGLDQDVIVKHRYKVNEFHEVENAEDIYALGDIALMQTSAFPDGHPQVAQPAIQQAKNLANNLKAALKNEKPKAFKYFDKGTMATIGRHKAVVDLNKTTLSGTMAWYIWMLVHLWFLVGFRNRIITFANWIYNYIKYDKGARLIIRKSKPTAKL
ncbi:NADH dehydrogenase [Psychroflexus salarius]|uniref:NADH:ubiquinone reductase (non-electrogenic) n=1 Tax=Psychroflexus salarius TaxID=1155689 RepID=A0A1M4WAJ8_9FLAO|nr:NAD(P)/FAD-dependent oxidoreductase [Psychroflexus salarius]SHE78264.1 NADH dehydrogenase [Psychroflexus salarius]